MDLTPVVEPMGICLIVIGIVMLIVAVLGIVGTCCNLRLIVALVSTLCNHSVTGVTWTVDINMLFNRIKPVCGNTIAAFLIKEDMACYMYLSNFIKQKLSSF